MSGHNKWSQIKNKKAITDAKKSKIFSKLVKFIAVEARLSGGKDSPGLRSAIEKAKKVNMPKDIIERAVKKASDSNVTMENIMYESYGPGGVGVIIETLTDSRNRTAQDVKHILAENGTTFAGIGSEGYEAIRLSRQFLGIELKAEYWDAAIKNLQRAEHDAHAQLRMFGGTT